MESLPSLDGSSASCAREVPSLPSCRSQGGDAVFENSDASLPSVGGGVATSDGGASSEGSTSRRSDDPASSTEGSSVGSASVRSARRGVPAATKRDPMLSQNAKMRFCAKAVEPILEGRAPARGLFAEAVTRVACEMLHSSALRGKAFSMMSDCCGILSHQHAIIGMLRSLPPDLRFRLFCAIACDTDPACQDFARRHYDLGVVLSDMTLRDWSLRRAVDASGKEVQLPSPRAVDLYVSTFPCTPFSSRGRRRAFADPSAAPYFATLETIDRARPKAVLIENVKGLLAHIDRVRADLDRLGGYGVHVEPCVSPLHFEEPADRDRIFVAAADNMSSASLTEAMTANLARLKSARSQDFLGERTFLDVLLASPGSARRCGGCSADALVRRGIQSRLDCQCRVDPDSACLAHPCLCPLCRRGALGRCRWRVVHKAFMEAHGLSSGSREERGYCWSRSIDVKSRRERNLIDLYAMLLIARGAVPSATHAVLDISQTIGSRTGFRTDGAAPIIATNTKLFAFAFDASLEPQDWHHFAAHS